MATSQPAVYLTSASALIKALKGASDPPQPDWPSKISIAHQAWSTDGLYVPRKAEVLRDWVLESWSRHGASSKGNTLLDPAYHELLSALSRTPIKQSQPPLQLLATFLHSLVSSSSANSISERLLASAASSFRTLFPVNSTLQKGEAWAEVWTQMIEVLATKQSLGSCEGLTDLVSLVCEGLSSSLPNSQNRKKIATSLLTSLPHYARALSHHPQLRSYLEPLTGPISFPLPALQLVNPFQPVLSALPLSVKEEDRPFLDILHHLLQSFIVATHQHRYPLFTQPSSSKLPLDVFLAEKVRTSVRTALALLLEAVNKLEDESLGSATVGTSSNIRLSDDQQRIQSAVWGCRQSVWNVINSWGGYMETESAWGDLVNAEARRAERALITFQGGESQDCDGASLDVIILKTLNILEGLDHGRTSIGSDVVGWCLASPKRTHSAALTLLSALLRYHHLTHSLHQFFNLLITAIKALFQPSQALPMNIVVPLYTLIANGPLTSSEFTMEIQNAVKSVNVGGQRSSSWAGIVFDLVEAIRSASKPSNGSAEDGSIAKKRKLRDTDTLGSGCSATIAILSRLLKVVVNASRSAKTGSEEVENSLNEILRAFDGISEEVQGRTEDVDGPAGKKNKKDKKGKRSVEEHTKDWAGDLVLAARLRVFRGVQLIRRETSLEIEEELLIGKLSSVDVLSETRLELVEYFVQRIALDLDSFGETRVMASKFVDALLHILETNADSWKGRSNLSLTELGSASWEVIADRGMVILDAIANGKQLERLSKRVISILATDGASGKQDESSISAINAVRRILASSVTWELPNLRAALILTILETGSSTNQLDPSSLVGTFDFLNSSPTAFLSRPARSTLLDSAYKIDLSLDDDKTETRSMIREWLARLASENDILGSLNTDSKLLKRLAKTSFPKDDISCTRATEATLVILRSAYTSICRSPEHTTEVIKDLLDDANKARPLAKWSKRLRKEPSRAVAKDLRAQAVLTLCEVVIKSGSKDRYSELLRSGLSSLLVAMVEDLQLVVAFALSATCDVETQLGVFKAWRTALQLARWLSVSDTQAVRIGQKLLGSIIQRVREQRVSPSLGELAAINLDIMSLESVESGSGTAENILAAFIILTSVIPCAKIDEALVRFVKSSHKDVYESLIVNTTSLLSTATASQGKTRSALHALTLLIGIPVEGSGKSVGRVLHSILLVIGTGIKEWSTPLLHETMLFLDKLSSERTGVLNQPTVSTIWSIILQILLPNPNILRSTTAIKEIFPLVLSTISTIIRHRADMIIITLPQIVAVLCTTFPLFQQPRLSSTENNSVARKRVFSRLPPWISDENGQGLSEFEAKSLSRLLTSLSTGKTSSSRLTNRDLDHSTKSNNTIAGPLAKQAPSILVAYVRSTTDPLAGLSTDVRRELESGLWSLCDVLTVGGRVDGRGREGEGLGVPFGLGDGVGGDAEREVWAGLWLAWGKRRYVGLG